jgi:hypothetical protein
MRSQSPTEDVIAEQQEMILGLRIGMTLLALVGMSLAGRAWLLWSDTPNAFREERFRQIKVGTSADAVFESLGYPFEFVVLSLRPSGSWNPPVDYNAPLRFTDVRDAIPYLSNANTRVVLEYSRPRHGGSFRARQILVSGGWVINRDAHDFWNW